MIKKTISFVDYNGNERKEDFYFNLNKAELVEMEVSVDGGLSEYIKKIVATRDGKAIINAFKDLIMKSVGEKSLDGRRFIKSEEFAKEFSQTEAYVNLYMELATDADKGAEFVNGILPDAIDKEGLAEKMKADSGLALVDSNN